MFKRQVLIAFLTAQLLLTVVLGSSVAYGMERGQAPPGLTGGGVDLTGLTRDQAEAALFRRIPRAVSFQGQTYPLKVDESEQAVVGWLADQYAAAGKTWLIQAFLRLAQVKQGAEPLELLSRDEIYPQLLAVKAKIDRPAQAAKASWESGRLAIEPDSVGLEVDVDGTWRSLRKSAGEAVVPLVVKSSIEHPTEAEAGRIKDVLGDYTTYYDPVDAARTTNVRLAAKALDGRLVAPGEEFSFNATVGERSAVLGYQPAYIFADQKVVKGDGGGVCQDSSTLYQAVRQARLAVTERHTHSLPVAYVPKGEDATVAYGVLDFRFRNDTSAYLLLRVRTGSNWLRVQIYGEADAKHPALVSPAGYPRHPAEFSQDPK